MKGLRLFLSLWAITFCTHLFSAQRNTQPGPGWWGELDHREARGLGYEDGYTTAEFFLSPTWSNPVQPFVDLRGHIFNNGKWAANVGVGFRYQFNNRKSAFGLNGYYDFRDADELNSLHQLGLGLEYLAKWIEFRSNGYAPLGNSDVAKPAKFKEFMGYNIVAQNEIAAALPHIDAEIGFPFRKLGPISMFLGVGGYYLFERCVEGNTLGQAWGAKGRLELGVYDGILLGGSFTYDKIFDLRVQGYIGLSIPLGPRNLRQGGARFRREYPGNAEVRAAQFARVTQKVIRDEIIPVELSNNIFCLLPCDCTCRILFVDNCCPGGMGSFESPFATLKEAEAASLPGDIIYVFAGNGFPDGMDEGIILQDNQRLIGSAVSFEVCDICVPACSPCCYPVITNIDGPIAIELANCNEVAGFIIEGPTGGMDPTGIYTFNSANYFLRDLIIQDLVDGIGIGSVEEETLDPSPCGNKIITDLCIRASDQDSVGLAITADGGNISVSCTNIVDIGGLQATVNMVRQGTISIDNSVFARQLADDTSVSIAAFEEGTCVFFNNNCITSGDLGLDIELIGDPCMNIQVCNNQITSVNEAILIETVGRQNCVTVTCNQICSGERSIAIIAGDGGPIFPDCTSFCIQDNCANGSLLLDAGLTTSPFSPSCLSLIGNDMPIYELVPGELGSLDVESTDGRQGVQDLNERGIVVPNPFLRFVEVGTCGCDCR